MIARTQQPQANDRLSTNSRRVLLLDDDPRLESLVASVCQKHQWTVSVLGERGNTLLPGRVPRPKLLLLGFTLDDENALELLYDLHATSPDAPLAVITGDSPDDVADVVGLAGGSAFLAGPTGVDDDEAPATLEFD